MMAHENSDWVGSVDVVAYRLRDDGEIPNNRLPLLVYPGVLKLVEEDPAGVCEKVFAANGWGNLWRNGIFSFPHYHATAHEVLGICSGQATVRFGGKTGEVLSVTAGDVVVIPAGVGHQNLGSSPELLVVGGYPPGQHPDMCYGKVEEREGAVREIAKVGFPATDPLYGKNGPLKEEWK